MKPLRGFLSFYNHAVSEIHRYIPWLSFPVFRRFSCCDG